MIFAAFGSTHDQEPYHGWVVGYDAATLQLYTVYNDTPNGYGGSLWQSGVAPAVDSQGNLYITSGNGAFSAYSTNTPLGPSALGLSDMGLGYAGIPNSAAVMFSPIFPSSAHNSTGLYYNGVVPGANPVSPNTFLNIDNSGINYQLAAQDQAGPHTFQVTLSYDGSNLTEKIEDTTTHAVYTHTYANANLQAAVGGNMAYVGFGGSNDARQAKQNITSWTYSANGSTVIDHSGGFASHGDLTANGQAEFTMPSGSSETVAQLTGANFDQAGTVFSNNKVDISHFTTTFQFQMIPGTTPIGDGITFIIQDAQGHPFAPNYGDTMLKLAPTPGTMKLVDSFTPANQQGYAIKDLDFGTAGTILLPSFPGTAHPNLAVELAKNGTLFVVDANHMGGLAQPLQSFPVNNLSLGRLNSVGLWGSMSYHNGVLYVHAADDVVKAFQINLDPATNTMKFDPTPISQGNLPAAYFPGDSTTISSNNGANAILWDLNTNGFVRGGACGAEGVQPQQPVSGPL